MASTARSAAYRLNARESAGPARSGAGRSPLQHPPAEFGSTARPAVSGKDPARIVNWQSRADLSNDTNERDVDGKPIPCSQKPI